MTKFFKSAYYNQEQIKKSQNIGLFNFNLNTSENKIKLRKKSRTNCIQDTKKLPQDQNEAYSVQKLRNQPQLKHWYLLWHRKTGQDPSATT